jgi:methylenetetrahydrofolate dehydrogenase (NADP+) / methenyltetrahydrofolate cyclohydrolase
MEINCQTIYNELLEEVRTKLKKAQGALVPPKMVIFSIKPDELTQIFLRQKQKLANSLGIECQIVKYDEIPLFQRFATDIRAAGRSRKNHAVIIQRPLPPELTSPTLENFIPLIKEVEGTKYKTPYFSPVGMTVLSLLKYIGTDFRQWRIRPGDTEFFKRHYKKKFIVLAGRGKTTGTPIANTMVQFKLALIITHSQTPEPENFYRQADVIVSSTGKPIINPATIKNGAILINFGYRREQEKTLGDYQESEIANLASFYTPVIHGTGPISLAYLMKNVTQAYFSATPGV